MDISIINHSLSNIHLVWTSDESLEYEVSIFDENRSLILHKKTKQCTYKSNFTFRTGHHIVKVNKNEIHSIIPAICRLSTGGSATLISGAQFGFDRPFILTANHCIPSPEIAAQSLAYFENQSVQLMPDIFWSSSPRCKERGIDYSMIGIKTEDVLKLRSNNIYPHNISTDAFPNNIGLLAFFKSDTGNTLFKTVCHITSNSVNCVKYKYGENYTKSGGGSSGSPVFGFDYNSKLVLQGLHVAHGKSILIGAISFAVNHSFAGCV
jgi:hypothetical protein